MTHVFGMGNPLLDISSDVEKEFLDKFELNSGTTILVQNEDTTLEDTLSAEHDVEYIAGGATQNSIRVCQWMLQKPGATMFTGAVGLDEYGKHLEKAASSDGLVPLYQKINEYGTGTCAVLVYDKERTLVANLRAANHFTADHLDTISENWHQSMVYYVSGFFLTVSPEAMEKIAKFSGENGKLFCSNISAPFLCSPPFFERMLALMPYIDVLFGNENEAVAFGKGKGWISEDEPDAVQKIPEIMKQISSLPKATDKPRMIIITQGADPVLVYNPAESNEVLSYPVPLVPKEEIADTNGAGDSFVGGFLAQLVMYQEAGSEIHIGKCVKAGQYASSYIIRRSGCTLADKPEYELEK